MDWPTNAKAIRELWPDAIWNDTLREVWRSELEPLEQDALRDALVMVKKTYASQQPEIKWVLGCYSTVQSDRRVQRYKPAARGEKHLIETPDEKAERELFQQWRTAIESLRVDEADTIKEQIMSHMIAGRLSSPTTYTLLMAVNEKCGKDAA